MLANYFLLSSLLTYQIDYHGFTLLANNPYSTQQWSQSESILF